MRDLLKYLIFSVATIWSLSCGQKTSSFSINDTQSLRESDPCCNCKMTTFVVDSISSNKNAEMITESIAIEFFNLRDKIDRFDGVGPMDSLPKKLRDKNRQRIYETIDQNEMYKGYALPVLKEKKIKIMKGNFHERILTFSCKDQPYTIDISYFNEFDGVIMYKTNKKPVLWTLDRFDKTCTIERFLDCYYD